MQNGKEDACVDVQHKKRGRPRLRDDHRGAGFESRLGQSQDQSLRRPLSLYTPQGSLGSGFDDSLRRTQSYRVLKSQPPEPLAHRFLERGSASGASVYPAPLAISTTTTPPEPAAFLTMDLEVVKASSTFWDAVGRPLIQSPRITEMLALGDREKIVALQRQMQDEQTRREPNYLPPMYAKQEEENVLRSLGFSREEIASYSLEFLENLRFNDQTGQLRNLSVRLGLAKRGSIYFIVVVVNTNTAFRGFQPPTPSPQGRDPRDLAYSYPAPQMPYPQPTPVSATFDHGRGRSASDVAYFPRQPATPGQMMPGLSPRLPSSYAASPSRPDYPAGHPAYQIPRSELSTAPRTLQAPGYQLPPIRQPTQFPTPAQSQVQPQQPQYHHQTQHQGGPSEQGWPRDDRQRVHIEGLIDRPDATHRH